MCFRLSVEKKYTKYFIAIEGELGLFAICIRHILRILKCLFFLKDAIKFAELGAQRYEIYKAELSMKISFLFLPVLFFLVRYGNKANWFQVCRLLTDAAVFKPLQICYKLLYIHTSSVSLFV